MKYAGEKFSEEWTALFIGDDVPDEFAIAKGKEIGADVVARDVWLPRGEYWHFNRPPFELLEAMDTSKAKPLMTSSRYDACAKIWNPTDEQMEQLTAEYEQSIAKLKQLAAEEIRKILEAEKS